MNYTKQALTIDKQIGKLKSRGLKIKDEKKVKDYLSNISYYRLRAYTYPFQDNTDPKHPFILDISFEDIIDIYVFDRRLRMLIFNAIEKIEVAVRTKIIYHYSVSCGSHWYENLDNFKDKQKFDKNISKLCEEVKRSKETFIDHYKKKYTEPVNPPAWMSLEVVTIGLLSKFYNNLINSPEKKIIAKEFGLPHYKFLESWLHCITHLRNISAHHSRIWNRRFTLIPKLPRNTSYYLLTNHNFHINKLYPQLCIINYLLKIISPESDFVVNIKNLISEFEVINIQEMGFPENWLEEEIWK